MKSAICDTNGHLINVITILTAHWEADERACKRDKIKREKSSSNFSHISGSKLWCSSLTPATVTAGIFGFLASGAAPARVLGGKRGAEGAEQEKSDLGIREILLPETLVAAAQSCLDKAEGDGEELNDCDSNDKGKCLRRKRQGPFLERSLANVRFTGFCGVFPS